MSHFGHSEMFELRHLLVELVEDLRLRKKCEEDEEVKIQDLINKNHSLQRSKDTEEHRARLREEKLEKSISDLKQQYEEMIKRMNVDKHKRQVKTGSKEHTEEQMAEEMRQLQIAKYQQDKIIKELKTKLQYQENCLQKKLDDWVCVERKVTDLTEVYHSTSQSVVRLEKTISDVSSYNRKLTYQNQHYKCLMADKVQQVKQLQGEILKVKVQLTSQSGDSLEIQKLREKMETMTLQTQALERQREKLTEELRQQSENAQQAIASVQDAHVLVSKHLENANSNREELERQTAEKKALSECCDGLKKDLATLQKDLESERWNHKEERVEWKSKIKQLQDKLDTSATQLESAMETNKVLEELNSGLVEKEEELTQQLAQAMTQLMAPKSDVGIQTGCGINDYTDKQSQTISDTTDTSVQTTSSELIQQGSQTHHLYLVSTLVQTTWPLTQDSTTQTFSNVRVTESWAQTQGLNFVHKMTQTIPTAVVLPDSFLFRAEQDFVPQTENSNAFSSSLSPRQIKIETPQGDVRSWSNDVHQVSQPVEDGRRYSNLSIMQSSFGDSNLATSTQSTSSDNDSFPIQEPCPNKHPNIWHSTTYSNDVIPHRRINMWDNSNLFNITPWQKVENVSSAEILREDHEGETIETFVMTSSPPVSQNMEFGQLDHQEKENVTNQNSDDCPVDRSSFKFSNSFQGKIRIEAQTQREDRDNLSSTSMVIGECMISSIFNRTDNTSLNKDVDVVGSSMINRDKNSRDGLHISEKVDYGSNIGSGDTDLMASPPFGNFSMNRPGSHLSSSSDAYDNNIGYPTKALVTASTFGGQSENIWSSHASLKTNSNNGQAEASITENLAFWGKSFSNHNKPPAPRNEKISQLKDASALSLDNDERQLPSAEKCKDQNYSPQGCHLEGEVKNSVHLSKSQTVASHRKVPHSLKLDRSVRSVAKTITPSWQAQSSSRPATTDDTNVVDLKQRDSFESMPSYTEHLNTAMSKPAKMTTLNPCVLISPLLPSSFLGFSRISNSLPKQSKGPGDLQEENTVSKNTSAKGRKKGEGKGLSPGKVSKRKLDENTFPDAFHQFQGLSCPKLQKSNDNSVKQNQTSKHSSALQGRQHVPHIMAQRKENCSQKQSVMQTPKETVERKWPGTSKKSRPKRESLFKACTSCDSQSMVTMATNSRQPPTKPKGILKGPYGSKGESNGSKSVTWPEKLESYKSYFSSQSQDSQSIEALTETVSLKSLSKSSTLQVLPMVYHNKTCSVKSITSSCSPPETSAASRSVSVPKTQETDTRQHTGPCVVVPETPRLDANENEPGPSSQSPLFSGAESGFGIEIMDDQLEVTATIRDNMESPSPKLQETF